MALLSLPLKQRVHSFLSAQGVPPSSKLNRNFEQILSLMQRRRDDDEFWQPLTDLLRALVDSVVRSSEPTASLRPEARLLALWDVSGVARLVRVALPREHPTKSTSPEPVAGCVTQLARSLTPSALGLFLVLSLAASACDSPSTPMHGSAGTSMGGSTSGGRSSSGGAMPTYHIDVTGGAPSSGTFATVCQRDSGIEAEDDAGYPLPANCCNDTASELWYAIDQSSLSSSDKQTLYTCLVNLNASWCDGLVQIFQTGTASDVANYLSKLLYCCDVRKSSSLTGDFAQMRQSLLQGVLCAVPLYKGVTFPS